MRQGVKQTNIDSFPITLSAAVLYSIAIMPDVVVPGIVGSAAISLDLTESQLGLFVSMFAAGMGLTGISAYFWIRKCNWRRVSVIGATLMSLAFVLMGLVERLPILMLLMFACGCGGGLLGSPAITVFGDSSEPGKGFSLMIIFSVISAACLLALFPYVGEKAGFTGVACVMAGTILLSAVLIWQLPVNNSVKSAVLQEINHNVTSQGLSLLPILALLVGFLFTMGFMGSWAFLERVAHYAALPPNAIGQALSIGSLFGAIGAPVAVYYLRRHTMYYCYGVTVVGIVLSLLAFTHIPLTNLSYLVLVCSFQFWINAGFCINMVLIAEVDKAGRFVVMINASQALGTVIGLIIAGFMFELFGSDMMISFFVGIFIVSVGIFRFVERQDRLLNETFSRQLAKIECG